MASHNVAARHHEHEAKRESGVTLRLFLTQHNVHSGFLRRNVMPVPVLAVRTGVRIGDLALERLRKYSVQPALLSQQPFYSGMHRSPALLELGFVRWFHEWQIEPVTVAKVDARPHASIVALPSTVGDSESRPTSEPLGKGSRPTFSPARERAADNVAPIAVVSNLFGATA